MGFKFWFKRWFLVFVSVFTLLSIVYIIKGYEVSNAFLSALIWSLISTTVFVATRLYHSTKGKKCAMCNDTPD